MPRDLNTLVATAAAQVDSDVDHKIGASIHVILTWIEKAPPLVRLRLLDEIEQLFTQLATADRPMFLSEFLGQVQPAALPAATPNHDELRLIGLGREVENDAEIAALVRRLLSDGTGAVGTIDPSTGQLGIEQELADERSEVANLQKLVEDLEKVFERLGAKSARSLKTSDIIKAVQDEARKDFVSQAEFESLVLKTADEMKKLDDKIIALEAERDRLQAELAAAKAAKSRRFRITGGGSGEPA